MPKKAHLIWFTNLRSKGSPSFMSPCKLFAMWIGAPFTGPRTNGQLMLGMWVWSYAFQVGRHHWKLIRPGAHAHHAPIEWFDLQTSKAMVVPSHDTFKIIWCVRGGPLDWLQPNKMAKWFRVFVMWHVEWSDRRQRKLIRPGMSMYHVHGLRALSHNHCSEPMLCELLKYRIRNDVLRMKQCQPFTNKKNGITG